MKKIISFLLSVGLIVSLFCGCEMREDIVVQNDGKCVVNLTTIIPVDQVQEGGTTTVNGKDVTTLPIEKVDGVDCYVDKQSKSYTSTEKLAQEFTTDTEDNKAMFSNFQLTSSYFEGALIDDVAMFPRLGIILKMSITFPYEIIKANGTISEDNRTVTYVIGATDSKIYAYTNQSKSLISKANLTLSSSKYTYDGKPKKPSVSVKYNGLKLNNGTDYVVSYKNNKNAGTASVTVTGKGNYTGSVTKYFTINKQSISKANLKLSTSRYTYDGKTKKPSVSVKYNGLKLNNGTDYVVSYKNNKNVGIATIKISGRGNYNGINNLSFKIIPHNTSLKSVTGSAKKITVKWKKQSTQTTGYQIQYSTSKKFSGAKTVTVKKNSTTSSTIKNLKSKKTYYVRVRTYKTVSGKNYYSSWSKAKSTKTK